MTKNWNSIWRLAAILDGAIIRHLRKPDFWSMSRLTLLIFHLGTKFGAKMLIDAEIRVPYGYDPVLSSVVFDIMNQCDRQADGQIVSNTETAPQHIARYACASRSKMKSKVMVIIRNLRKAPRNHKVGRPKRLISVWNSDTLTTIFRLLSRFSGQTPRNKKMMMMMMSLETAGTVFL